jgi:hypothetical protein
MIQKNLKDCLRWAGVRSEQRGDPPPNFTLRFLLRLWERQGGRCALTGARLTCRARAPLGVTLDRIDPNKPYTQPAERGNQMQHIGTRHRLLGSR